LPQLSFVPICSICWLDLSSRPQPACARCGDTLDIPASIPAPAALCRTCRLAPPPFVRAVSFGLYEGRMQDAIHALKYGRLHPASRGLGKLLAQAIAGLAAEAPSDLLVVPVPLHRSKHEQRGFNQARTLAEQALRSLRLSHPAWHLTLAPSTLMRLRATESQAGLTARARRINLRGAFAVSDQTLVAERNILLIDDILTTGATARSAAHTLIAAGAASVWVATLARARKTGPLRKPPAQCRTKTKEREAPTDRIVHCKTNHLFDEGIKDVAGKSYDSRPQAKVHCQSCRRRGRRIHRRATYPHAAATRAGAERFL
jgi:ComF family protein